MIAKTVTRFARWIVPACLAITFAARAEPLVKDGDLLAICGDSITEQRQYSVFIESYLRLCQPAKVNVMQFGWGGESAPRFLNRMKWDVLAFNPTIATTCYGMNDGDYKAIEDATREKFRTAMAGIVKTFQEANVRVVVGSGGAVDPRSFNRGPPADVYNNTLAALRDEARKIAGETNSTFADVHQPMRDVTDAAESKLPAPYFVCGPDGFHPTANGHLVMAYAFLKALGFDGEIGKINVDLSAGTATASTGHTVAKVDVDIAGAAIEIESTRYPFCFFGQPDSVNATSGIIEFFPFNDELNRLTLQVTGSTSKYRVSWGTVQREYSAEQLTKGVNLAADFIPNPFNEPFTTVEKAIREKQAFETKYLKGLAHSIGDARAQFGDDPALTAGIDWIKSRETVLTRAVTDAIRPVKHRIVIEPIAD